MPGKLESDRVIVNNVRGDTGCVVLLDATTRKPLANIQLRLYEDGTTRDGAEQTRAQAIEVHTSRDGEVETPTGRWRIEAATSQYRLEESLYEVAPGGVTTVWAYPVLDLQIVVTDGTNRVVPGASIRWSTGTRPSAPYEFTYAEAAKTDNQGMALIRQLRLPTNILVHKDGYYVSNTYLPSGTRTLKVALTRVRRYAILRVLDATSGQPIDAVIASDEMEPLPLEELRGGLYRTPEVPDRRVVYCEAPGYCKSEVVIPGATESEPAPLTVELVPGVDVSLEPHDLDSMAMVWPQCQLLGKTVTNMRVAQYVDIAPGTRSMLRCPANSMLQLHGASARGQQTTAAARVGESPMVVRLDFESKNPLNIAIVDEQGRTPKRARATICYGDGRFLLGQCGERGAIQVGVPEKVLYVDIESEGAEKVRLLPTPDHTLQDVPCFGVVRVVCSKSFPVELQLATEANEPSPGTRIHIRGNAIAEAFRRHPELAGSTPTDHPRWVQRCQPDTYLTTSGAGVACCYLTAGKYRVDIMLPREVSDGVKCYLVERPREIEVAGAVRERIVVDGTRCLRLVVTDSYTGGPIEPYTVRAAARGLQGGVTVKNSPMVAWLPRRVGSITVTAENYEAEDIVLSDAEDGEVKAVLRPRARAMNGSARFEGPGAAGLIGARLRFVGITEGVGGSAEEARVVWEKVVVIRTPENVPLWVEAGEPLRVEVAGEDGGWRIKPVQANWRKGMQLTYWVE